MQERIRELPGLAGPGQSADLGGRPLTYLPGSEFENEFDQRASAQVCHRYFSSIA